MKITSSTILTNFGCRKSKFQTLFTTFNNVSDMWDFIKTEFSKIIENNVPTKLTSTKFHQPWINTETKRLLRRKNKWFKKAKTLNTPHAWKMLRGKPRGPVDRHMISTYLTSFRKTSQIKNCGRISKIENKKT